MKARTPVVILLALLPVLILSIYAIGIREMRIGPEIIFVVAVRYVLALGAAAVITLPLHFLWRRDRAARGRKSVIVFLCLSILLVLAHILASITLT